MPGCLYRCPDVNDSSLYTSWSGTRDHYGPKPNAMTDEKHDALYAEDLGDYITWADDTGRDSDPYDPSLFQKFLNWKLSIGTTNYGNLPQRKREHTGISCIPCPYDTDSSAERSEYWLGEPVGTQVDHGEHYMRVANRGRIWGFECTYSGCPYEVANGRPYFYA